MIRLSGDLTFQSGERLITIDFDADGIGYMRFTDWKEISLLFETYKPSLRKLLGYRKRSSHLANEMHFLVDGETKLIFHEGKISNYELATLLRLFWYYLKAKLRF